MKKIMAVWSVQSLGLVVICLLIVVMASMAASVADADELVLVAADSAPTAYMEDGKLSGILVDIMTEAFKRADHPIKIQLMPWARCLAEVRDGRVDGIFSAFRLPEREEFLTYTDIPIITQVEAFFVRADSAITFDGDLKTLQDVAIGVIKDTSYGEKIDGAIDDGTWKNVSETANVDSLVAMLIAKRFDLVPSYRHVFLAAAKRIDAVENIKELSPSVDSIPSYLAFTKKRDYTDIISDFTKALTEMIDDGTFDAIYDKYLK